VLGRYDARGVRAAGFAPVTSPKRAMTKTPGEYDLTEYQRDWYLKDWRPRSKSIPFGSRAREGGGESNGWKLDGGSGADLYPAEASFVYMTGLDTDLSPKGKGAVGPGAIWVSPRSWPYSASDCDEPRPHI